MSSTARELFDAALRQHAKHKAGDYLSCWHIGVPHQLPPRLIDSGYNPPETDGEMADQYVKGDHDFHTCIHVLDGLTYRGHQGAEVVGLARRKIREVLDYGWEEQVLCELYAFEHMTNADFKRLGDDLLWHGVWPEVDGSCHLTGRIVSDEEGYVNIDDEAMMREETAIASGLDVVDGRAKRVEVSDG
jgi:hypothetical protein